MNRSKYLAWVPCLGGRIFFAKTDISLGDYDFHSFNREFKNPDNSVSRKIVLSSVVDWQDTKHWKEPFAGLVRVILVAKTNRKNDLVGRIYFIEKGSGVSFDKSSFVKYFRPRPNIEQEIGLLGLMRQLASIEEKNDSLSTEEEAATTRLVASIARGLKLLVISKDDVYTTRFKVRESGLATFSTSYDDEKGELVARQAFYYLKYALHTHVHHSQSSETLTTIHKDCGDYHRNALNLIDDIKRGINEYRTSVPKSSFAVSGIALYGTSLIRTLQSEWGKDKDEEKKIDTHFIRNQLTFFRNIRDSIDLCGGHQPETWSGFFRQKLKTSLALFFVIATPILHYLNTRPSSDPILIETIISKEKAEFCGVDAVAGSFCVRFYNAIEYYILGGVTPGFLIVFFLAWSVILVNIVRSNMARHIDGTGKAKRIYSYIVPFAHSDRRGLKSFFYKLVLCRLVVRRLFISIQQPKKILGICMTIGFLALALWLSWRLFVSGIRVLTS